MSFSAVYNTQIETFESYTWDYTRGTLNDFGTIGIDIWLFDSQVYSTYADWLNSQTALDLVDNSSSEVPLNASTLNTFQSKITEYSNGRAIFMRVQHEVFTVANQ